MPENHDNATTLQISLEQIATSEDQSCNKSDCKCCSSWRQKYYALLDMFNTVADMPENISGITDSNACLAKTCLEVLGKAESEKKKYAKLNKLHNLTINGIRTVPVVERKTSGKRGRPKGQKATINRRPEEIDREETVDCKECPHCGNGDLSEVTDKYDRVVEVLRCIKEDVKYEILRRYCGKCKKQVSNNAPNVIKYARTSANHTALMTHLNMNGFSHGKVAETSSDALKVRIPRSRSYRNKISTSKKMAPDYKSIMKSILAEIALGCDEMWWPIGRINGFILVALGNSGCLMLVSESRSIEAVNEFLPEFEGIIIQDSHTSWLHVGTDHQMCLWHQMRIIKKDLKYNSPNKEATELIEKLLAILKRLYKADEITDTNERVVAADRFDAELHHLMDREHGDGKKGTINRYQKRFNRECDFLTTFLRHEKGKIPPDNNACERANRQVVAIRSNGGGNRSAKGMTANSILLTNKLTDWVNGESFFDHLVRVSSGDG